MEAIFKYQHGNGFAVYKNVWNKYFFSYLLCITVLQFTSSYLPFFSCCTVKFHYNASRSGAKLTSHICWLCMLFMYLFFQDYSRQLNRSSIITDLQIPESIHGCTTKSSIHHIQSIGWLSLWKRMSQMMLEAVSYTHLDVYKRQI